MKIKSTNINKEIDRSISSITINRNGQILDQNGNLIAFFGNVRNQLILNVNDIDNVFQCEKITFDTSKHFHAEREKNSQKTIEKDESLLNLDVGDWVYDETVEIKDRGQDNICYPVLYEIVEVIDKQKNLYKVIVRSNGGSRLKENGPTFNQMFNFYGAKKARRATIKEVLHYYLNQENQQNG